MITEVVCSIISNILYRERLFRICSGTLIDCETDAVLFEMIDSSKAKWQNIVGLTLLNTENDNNVIEDEKLLVSDLVKYVAFLN